MSNVGDALSGSGSSASGVNDQTFADASLGDQMQGGTGDFTGGDAGGGPTEFNQFSDVANALSSGTPAGASPTVAQSAAMNPPSAAAATGGDPVGAASGTQSGTTPGSSPTGQNQQQQTGQTQNPQDQNQYAPKSATDQLKALLKQLSGKPTGPTGPTVPAAASAPFAPPTLAAGQTGRPSFTPAMIGGMPNEGGIPNLPAVAAGETGTPSGQLALPEVAAGETGAQSPGSFLGTSVQPQGGPSPASQVAGAPAAEARIPPGAASAPTASPEGRQITVRKPAQPQPTPDQPQPDQTADLPTRVPHPAAALPTHKPGAEPAPEPPTGAGATPRILQDISGASTGSPTALADLAQAARIIVPMLPMLAGLFGGGGRGRRGGFHGGRFTHGVGGFRGGHPGQFGHPAWRGAWPYHHPMHGWDMHHTHPGGGWLPLNPAELPGMGGGQGGQPGQQGGPEGSNPTQTTEAGPGQPDDTFQKSGFSSNPFIDALVRQESGGGQNIVSKTDKDSQGRTLAQGGNPNEISQGYFQIQNHPGGTWGTYARQAGVDINKYPTPRSAPLAVQWQVAQRIPIGQWGPQTKAILRQKFGQFDPNMPFGQVATRFGPAGGRLAAATPSRTQPAWASGPASASLQLPVTSQPSVSASN
jgi:hypothetical protein